MAYNLVCAFPLYVKCSCWFITDLSSVLLKGDDASNKSAMSSVLFYFFRKKPPLYPYSLHSLQGVSYIFHCFSLWDWWLPFIPLPRAQITYAEAVDGWTRSRGALIDRYTFDHCTKINSQSSSHFACTLEILFEYEKDLKGMKHVKLTRSIAAV